MIYSFWIVSFPSIQEKKRLHSVKKNKIELRIHAGTDIWDKLNVLRGFPSKGITELVKM